MKVRASGTVVEVSHPEKVLFDEGNIDKAELVDYYRAVSGAILPHLRARPLALQRFPDGIEENGFLQKTVPPTAPPYAHRITVERVSGGHIDMLTCDNTATLIYVANQAAITLHPWLSRADALTRPDRLIFDLDPADENFTTVRHAALLLRDLLDELGLPAYPMITGSRGVHVTVPIAPREEFDVVRPFAQRVAELLVARSPKTLTTAVRKAERKGRLFVDTLRNGYAQHAVAPYSVRPLPGAPVATPVDWSELDDKRLSPCQFTIRDVPKRIDDADPWRGFGRRQPTLRRARSRVDSLERVDSDDLAAN